MTLVRLRACPDYVSHSPFRRVLNSDSFALSSSLRKSLVFWASSFLSTRASRWLVTISVAVESSWGMRFERLMPRKCVSLRLQVGVLGFSHTTPCSYRLLEFVLGLCRWVFNAPVVGAVGCRLVGLNDGKGIHTRVSESDELSSLILRDG